MSRGSVGPGGARMVTDISAAGKAAAETLAQAFTVNGIVRLGSLEYLCANDYDPTQDLESGEIGVIGARMDTVDGTKAWLKTGTGRFDELTITEGMTRQTTRAIAWVSIPAIGAVPAQFPRVANDLDPTSDGLYAVPGRIATALNDSAAWICFGTSPYEWIPLSKLGIYLPAEGNVAADFDPSVTGLSAPVGARVKLADGSRAWLKVGATDTSWLDVLRLSEYAGIADGARVIANTVDPRTDGLVAPVGTRARSADGTRSYRKYGTGNTNWIAERQNIATVTVPAGPAVGYVDLNIAVAANQGVEVVMQCLRDAGDRWQYLRINGAAPVAVKGRTETDASPYVIPWDGKIAAGSNTGSIRGGSFRLGPCLAGTNYREIRGSTLGSALDALCSAYHGLVTTTSGLLTSIGISDPDGNHLVEGTTITAIVDMPEVPR